MWEEMILQSFILRCPTSIDVPNNKSLLNDVPLLLHVNNLLMPVKTHYVADNSQLEFYSLMNVIVIRRKIT